jgi:hypothetical protein
MHYALLLCVFQENKCQKIFFKKHRPQICSEDILRFCAKASNCGLLAFSQSLSHETSFISPSRTGRLAPQTIMKINFGHSVAVYSMVASWYICEPIP